MTRHSMRVPLLRHLSMCAIALLVGAGLCGGDRLNKGPGPLSVIGALVIAVALLLGLSAIAADLLDFFFIRDPKRENMSGTGQDKDP